MIRVLSGGQYAYRELLGDAVTRFAYLDTLPYCGFIVELIETRLWGMNLGMPEWLIRVGQLTGATEIVR